MKEKNSTISSLILNYNDWKTTKHLALELNECSNITDVVIVDNCSSDDSYIKLKEIESTKIHVIKSEHKGGYGYGNNYGIKYIAENLQCTYVLICNPDVEISNECIGKLRTTMIENPKCAIAAPIQRLYKKDGKIILPWRLANKKEAVFSMSIAVSKVLKLDLSYNYDVLKESELYPCDVMQGALLMADLDFIYKYGLYDEEIFLYNEEECLAQKLKCRDKISLLLCQEYYIHQHSVSIDKCYKSLVAKKKLQLNSRLQYLKKYYHLSKIEKTMIKIFFEFCIAEMYVIQICCMFNNNWRK